MRTAIDTELFLDCCEVVEIPFHNQRVYLIQKNGHNVFRSQQKRYNLSVFTNEEISTLDYVDVYIRNPRARYVSGVNTYLQVLQRDHPELDADTAFWFAKRYKFLNSHCLPQFHWLANLSRYLRSDAKIRLRDFKNLDKIVDFFPERGFVTGPTKEFISKLLSDNKNLDLWLYLDQILLDLAGQEFTWSELLEYYQRNHKNIIEHVLPKT
jgi:hypothetical protein